MFRIDQTTAVTALPAPSAAGTPGFFTGGNPATGQAATIVSADWLNLVQEELMSFLTAAGIAPNKTSYGQVLQAVQQLFAASAGDATKLFQSKTPPAGDNSNSVATTAFVQGFAGGRKVVILSSTNWTVPAGVTVIWVSACAGELEPIKVEIAGARRAWKWVGGLGSLAFLVAGGLYSQWHPWADDIAKAKEARDAQLARWQDKAATDQQSNDRRLTVLEFRVGNVDGKANK
ncbi:hypothetical protein [Burkholderia glumae]